MNCPFCREEIIDGAAKCKHCKNFLTSHFQAMSCICPYCKEDIQSGAIKCKHCKSMLLGVQLPEQQVMPALSPANTPPNHEVVRNTVIGAAAGLLSAIGEDSTEPTENDDDAGSLLDAFFEE